MCNNRNWKWLEKTVSFFKPGEKEDGFAYLEALQIVNYGGQGRISLPVLHSSTLCLSECQNIEYESSFNYSKLEDTFPSKTTSGIRAGKKPFLGPRSN